jgi:hypothetical protein
MLTAREEIMGARPFTASLSGNAAASLLVSPFAFAAALDQSSVGPFPQSIASIGERNPNDPGFDAAAQKFTVGVTGRLHAIGLWVK